LQNNDITLMNDMPVVQSSQGKIEFNERGVNLNQLSGNFLGGPVSITGGSQKDGAIVVKLGGLMTADGFRQTYPMPAMQRLADHFSGGTRYAGTVTVRDHQVVVAVDSSLTGLGLELPAPVKKGVTDSMPLRFVLASGLTPDAGGLLHDDIRIALGSGIAARYQRQKLSNSKQHWKLVRGGIGVNTPAPEPDSGLAFNINLRELNVDNWLDFADRGGKGAAARQRSRTPATSPSTWCRTPSPRAPASWSSATASWKTSWSAPAIRNSWQAASIRPRPTAT
jgi:uncharacterized protein YhdP